MKRLVNFVVFIAAGIAVVCVAVFNLAVVTLPVWGGALILMALFG